MIGVFYLMNQFKIVQHFHQNYIMHIAKIIIEYQDLFQII